MNFLDGEWEPQHSEDLMVCGAAIGLPYFFVSGPMSKIEFFNHPLFDEVSAKLRERGFNVFNPAPLAADVLEKYEPQSDDEHYRLNLRECLRWVLHPNCDAIIVLPGWKDSSGSRLETFAAWTCGIPLYEFEDSEGGFAILNQVDWTMDETYRPTRAS